MKANFWYYVDTYGFGYLKEIIDGEKVIDNVNKGGPQNEDSETALGKPTSRSEAAAPTLMNKLAQQKFIFQLRFNALLYTVSKRSFSDTIELTITTLNQFEPTLLPKKSTDDSSTPSLAAISSALSIASLAVTSPRSTSSMPSISPPSKSTLSSPSSPRASSSSTALSPIFKLTLSVDYPVSLSSKSLTPSDCLLSQICEYYQSLNIRLDKAEIRLVHHGRELPLEESDSKQSCKRLFDLPLLAPFNILLVYEPRSKFVLDTISAPPALSISSNLLTARMLSDGKWSTVRSVTPFSRGRHSWRVSLDVCSAGNAFLGVCTASARLTNYLGNDSHGYGWYGCANIYRHGSSTTYSASFRTGDVIDVRLNMDTRELSFIKNDMQLPVAFTDLPDDCYPAFSLYSKDDQLTILSFDSW